MPWYHERHGRRGAGRRRNIIVPPVIYPPPDPGDPPDPPPASVLVPGWPYYASTTAYNMTVNNASRIGGFRVACPKAGTLSKFWLQLKVGENSGVVGGGSGSGYGGGDTGLLRGKLWSPDAAGKPSVLQYQDVDFRPGWYSVVSTQFGRGNQNSVYIDLGGYVAEEDELIIVTWQNAHLTPASNFFSINALHNNAGPWDAMLANNMAIDYAFASNGFDPRTNTVWSSNGGSSWSVPGGPAGGAFQPCYAIEYDDGSIYGQGCHYGATAPSSTITQTIKKCGTHTFTHIASGNPTSGSSAGNVTVKKNGSTVLTVTNLPAAVGVNRVALASPISVINTDVITLECNPGARGISNAVCDGVWDELLGWDTNMPIYPSNNTDARLALYLEPIPTAWKLLL
jgi:hypothetical protein